MKWQFKTYVYQEVRLNWYQLGGHLFYFSKNVFGINRSQDVFKNHSHCRVESSGNIQSPFHILYTQFYLLPIQSIKERQKKK